ncbi:MAG: aconitate hydratase, partial [Flammeovirgaceae bacterium]|nr:aconitate hydratase [Flammeovirgaceae bacterium]
MSRYSDYLIEIENREKLGLKAKPIDDALLLTEIISNIKDLNSKERSKSLHFFIYNILPGTTSAANVKSKFLKEIIIGKIQVDEIPIDFAYELLSHMKGGSSIEILLDLALGSDPIHNRKASDILKTQVFLYEADMERIKKAYEKGNTVAKGLLQSYSNAEFFTNLPEIPDKIELVTFVAGLGDISTDLLSPGGDAHSRSDRELHGKSMFDHDIEKQKELVELQRRYPEKRIMLVAEKGTMGVGSSRMSGVNNVALWIGNQASKYVPFINIAPVVAGTNGISPIFMTTVGVTGGIGLDLKNWVKTYDDDGNIQLNKEGDPILKRTYSVDTGTLLTIDTKTKKLFCGDKELMDISSAFTPQKMEFMRAGGS